MKKKNENAFYSSSVERSEKLLFIQQTEKALKNIIALSDQDVRVAEVVTELLKPLKIMKKLKSNETILSVSIILPLKTKMLFLCHHRRHLCCLS